MGSSTKCQTVYRRIEELNYDRPHRTSPPANAVSDALDVDAQGKATLSPSVRPASIRGETIETSAYRRIQIIEVRDIVGSGDILSNDFLSNDFSSFRINPMEQISLWNNGVDETQTMDPHTTYSGTYQDFSDSQYDYNSQLIRGIPFELC